MNYGDLPKADFSLRLNSFQRTLLTYTSMLWLTITSSCNAALSVVAVTGDLLPDGTTIFNQPDSGYGVTLNNAGQVAFKASISPGGAALLLGTTDSLVSIAGQGSATLQGDLANDVRSTVALSDSGEVVYVARFQDGRFGIIAGDEQSLTTLAREGDSALDGDGQLATFAGESLRINQMGDIAFFATLSNTSRNRVIMSSDGTAVQQLVRIGDSSPNSDGDFTSFGSDISLSDVGRVAFTGRLEGDACCESAVYAVDNGGLVQVAHEGEPSPTDGRDFAGFSSRSHINTNGDTVFVGGLQSSNVQNGIYMGDGISLTEIVFEGDTIAELGESFGGFQSPSLNDIGDVAFIDRVGFPNIGSRIGVFRYDGNSITNIVFAGDSAPDGRGTFNTSFSQLQLNNTGAVAFKGQLVGISPNDMGLFYQDDTEGLIQVARFGDSLLGSTIAQLLFTGNNASTSGQSGFNDLGQLAFWFSLADGRRGVAIWSPDSDVLAGDYNGDGTVDAADYTVWRDNYGATSGPGLVADGNVDGQVNGADYLIWQQHYGETVPTAASSEAFNVPEPSTAVLCALSLCFAMNHRREKSYSQSESTASRVS